MDKSIIGAVGACLVAISFNVNAVTITHGTLVYDDATNYILDTASGRQYLHFDAYNLSYNETIAASSAGGSLEDWSVADEDAALQFIFAITGGSTVCQGTSGYTSNCGKIAGPDDWVDGDFGANFYSHLDVVLFTPTDTNYNAGTIDLVDNPGFIDDHNVRFNNQWSNATNPYITDDSTYDVYSGLRYDWLLYKEPSPVPLPGTFALIAMGLSGLFVAGTRRKVISTRCNDE